MDVTAIIPTYGPGVSPTILASLAAVPRIRQVIVWDNSVRPDLKVFARHAAITEAEHDIIYSQDDDLVHLPGAIDAILDGYVPGKITGCMWPEWSAGAYAQGIANGYDDLVFPGSGSVYHASTAGDAVARYLEVYPYDEFFLLWCDAIIGVMMPNVQLPIRFLALPNAHTNDRMARLPNAAELKREAMERGRSLR